MASGVSVHPECLKAYQDLKLGKKLKYIIYTVSSDNKEVVVAKTSTSSDYEEFMQEMPENECRWAVYDFEYQKGDEGIRNKLCFFMWTPDEASVRQKMLFASSKDALRRSLVGLSAEIQGTDSSEVTYDSVLDKVNRLR